MSELSGFSTDVTQHANAYEQTLAAATRDAQLQATVVAHAAHLRLVRILTIDATQAPIFAPRVMGMMAKDAAPLAPDAADVQLSASVTVTFEIAPTDFNRNNKENP